MKIYSTNNKVLTKVGIGVIFSLLGFLIGMLIVNFLSPSKINPKPPIPTNYSLEQKNYDTTNNDIAYYHNGVTELYSALVLNNGSILSVDNKHKYFLDDTLIDMNIEYFLIFQGNNIQYGLINTNNKTILVNTDNILKPLQTLNFKIDKNETKPIVFNSFINIFTLKDTKQECIKIDTRSFDYKEIEIRLLNEYIIYSSFLIQQGNLYAIDRDKDLYVLDTETQKQNLDIYNYELLPQNFDFKFNIDNIINFSDDNIDNNLKNSTNYNIFLKNYKSNNTLSMVNKNGEEKLILKDYSAINSYIYAFETREPNKISLINLSKSVFSDEAVVFSKKINNKLLENSLLTIQSNNNNTYSIVIYNKIHSLLEVITLDNDLKDNEELKINHVNDFHFKWLNNETNVLQISKRPIVFTFKRDCYYITTPNDTHILLWKNEQLIKEYKSYLNTDRNFSPFLLQLKNIPIIVTKTEFFIINKKYNNTTIATEINTSSINISNDKIWINEYMHFRITSIIYLKIIKEN